MFHPMKPEHVTLLDFKVLKRVKFIVASSFVHLQEPEAVHDAETPEEADP